MAVTEVVHFTLRIATGATAGIIFHPVSYLRQVPLAPFPSHKMECEEPPKLERPNLQAYYNLGNQESSECRIWNLGEKREEGVRKTAEISCDGFRCLPAKGRKTGRDMYHH